MRSVDTSTFMLISTDQFQIDQIDQINFKFHLKFPLYNSYFSLTETALSFDICENMRIRYNLDVLIV
jgi:hypothetical protein